jgi:hypothetical protein
MRPWLVDVWRREYRFPFGMPGWHVHGITVSFVVGHLLMSLALEEGGWSVRHLWCKITLPVLAGLVLALPLFWLHLRAVGPIYKKVALLHGQLCVRCGYGMPRAEDGQRCPECGRAYIGEESEYLAQRLLHRYAWVFGRQSR